MAKYIYIHSSLEPSGPTSQLLSIINSNQINSGIYLFLIKKKSRYLKYNLNKNIIIISNLYKLILIIYRSKSKIICHSSGFKSDILNLFLKIFSLGKIKPVSTLRNIPWEDYPLLYGSCGYLYSLVHLLFLSNLNVICCSKPVYKIYKTSFLCSIRSTFIDNACAIEFPKLELKKKSYPLKNFRLISLAPLVKRKQIVELIKLLDYSNHDFYLDIYGEGNLKFEIEKLCQTRENISFKGYKHIKSIDLDIYDAVISLSLSEGLPNSIIEFIVSGKYAIVSDIPAHIYLKKFCSNVLIFNKNSLSSLNRALKQVKRLPPNKLEFAKARNYFSMNRMIKEYHKYYEDLISDQLTTFKN